MKNKSFSSRIYTAILAARELGWRRVSLYARYRLGLVSGHYRRATPAVDESKFSGDINPAILANAWKAEYPLVIPTAGALMSIIGPEEQAHTIQAANDICGGKMMYFGGIPRSLELRPQMPLRHWTERSVEEDAGIDIKDVWEPARFGWVYPLARAYCLTGDERYPRAFIEHAATFFDSNPPNVGPNWASAQEVALRLMALAFAGEVFRGSLQRAPEQKIRLLAQIACHADRIPPTLTYARAQDNNHLISEAVGLVTAAELMPDHPNSSWWRSLGWRWFNWSIHNQIGEDGEYIQHSTNYQRMLLHHSLWMDRIARIDGRQLTTAARKKLAAATRWLLRLLDPISGQTPNLGHNDGSNLLPLSPLAWSDYRPVAQAAAVAFLGQPILGPGAWDELCLWLGLEIDLNPQITPPAIDLLNGRRLGDSKSWVILRTAPIHGRAAHADQLHLDIWHQGSNVACDPGTYRYNAPPPWENGLAGTAVHNTVEVDSQDQMLRASRFLWLKPARAWLDPAGCDDGTLTAEHDGYYRLGVRHRRVVKRSGDCVWEVIDELLPLRSKTSLHTTRLHWLLPDWQWRFTDNTLELDAPFGLIQLSVFTPEGVQPQLSLVRAGETLVGAPTPGPTLGWYSPTYGVKTPALSFSVTLRSALPLTYCCRWDLSAAARYFDEMG
ncbi:MAG: alginate lyase family protein [Anaerolineaceae bacterium]|nr:alginate lyase family protein [Anaerolineaceae bacterium]